MEQQRGGYGCRPAINSFSGWSGWIQHALGVDQAVYARHRWRGRGKVCKFGVCFESAFTSDMRCG